MRILLDVDGVLADMLTPLCRSAGIDPGDVVDHDLDLFIDSLDTHMQALDVSALEPYPGALRFVSVLRLRGYDVRAVTSPPLPSLGWGRGRWMEDRDQWLQDRLGFLPTEIVHCRDKHLVQGDFLLDDHPAHVQDRAGGWLMSRPYNQDYVGDRVSGYVEFLERIGA